MNFKSFFQLLGFILLSELAGVIGSLFTAPSIPTWYASLVRGPLNPPSWVFAPVWTTLFLFMGIAAFLVWKRGFKRKDVKRAFRVFLLQLGLNVLWSVLFFGLHHPLAAFVEILFLWLAILWTIVLFSRLSRPASALLWPYLLWVSFAAYLNFSLWTLNR
jgi:tryptophan-rich sensory protein